PGSRRPPPRRPRHSPHGVVFCSALGGRALAALPSAGSVLIAAPSASGAGRLPSTGSARDRCIAPTRPGARCAIRQCLFAVPLAVGPWGPSLRRALRAIAASLRLAQGLAARSGSVYLQCPWRSGPGGPPFGGLCARSLHRSDSPRGSLRDQVSRRLE